MRCEHCSWPSTVAVWMPSTGGSLCAAAGASLGQERALSLFPTAKCNSQLLAEGVEQFNRRGKGVVFSQKKVIERGLGTANRPWSFIGFNQPTPWRHGAKAGGSSFKPERCFHTACHYTVGLCHGSLAVPATASKHGRKKS